MKTQKSLRENASWVMIGTLAITVSQFGLLWLLARLGSSAMVGQFGIGLAIATPLAIFADRVIRTLQATAGPADAPLPAYLGFRCWLGAAAVAVGGAVSMASGFSSETTRLVVLVGLWRFVEGLSQVLYGYEQRCERMDYIGISQSLKAAMGCMTTGAIMLASHRLDLALCGLVFVTATVLVTYDHYNVRKLGRRFADTSRDYRRGQLRVTFSRSEADRMLRIGLPLGAATLLIALNASAPRYFVGTFLGEDSLGVFTVLCYLCFPATAVVSSLVQASTPQLAGGYRNGGHRGMEALLRRLVSASLVICLLQSSFILSAGPWLLEVVFGSTFVVSRPLLVWVVIATSAGALASIPATAISAQRHFRLSLAVCVVSTAIGIFACLATIPRWELFGAAAAMALSSVAHGTLAALVGGMGRAPAIIASRLTPTHSSA